MKRREFIAALGSAAAWPLAVRAQPAMPVVGLLSSVSAAGYAEFMAALHQGLAEAGFVEVARPTGAVLERVARTTGWQRATEAARHLME